MASQQAHELIKEFQNGSLNDQLTAVLREVADAVILNEKSGTVTLKLAMSEKAGGVVIASTITHTMPKAKNEAFYYVGDDGLSRRDPNQPTLPTMEETK